jgi:hypothetical protein
LHRWARPTFQPVPSSSLRAFSARTLRRGTFGLLSEQRSFATQAFGERSSFLVPTSSTDQDQQNSPMKVSTMPDKCPSCSTSGFGHLSNTAPSLGAACELCPVHESKIALSFFTVYIGNPINAFCLHKKMLFNSQETARYLNLNGT